MSKKRSKKRSLLRAWRMGALALAAFWLAGCALVATPAAGKGDKPLALPGATRLRPALGSGVEALERGDLPAASTAFNTVLNGDPDRAYVHVLNALTYHLMVARGDRTRFDLAAAGYQVARQLDPGNVAATRLLARLYLDAKRYREAKDLFAEAIVLEGHSVEMLHGLAISAYYTGDLALAQWAVRQLEAEGNASAETLRTAVLVNAAAGEPEAAAKAYARYAVVEQDGARRDYVRRRAGQWAATLAGWRADDPSPSPASAAPTPAPTPKTAPAPSGLDAAAMTPNWTDCPQASARASARASPQGASVSSAYPGSAYGGYPGYSGYAGQTSAAGGDETEALPALPSPCSGTHLPRMVQVDAAIIRTDDDLSTTKGINILDGLSVVLTGAYSSMRTSDGAGAHTRVWTRGLALPASGITYALNMFNVSELRAELLARPSLLALDRQPSRFFSGASITVAVAGQFTANLQEKPVGVSLSVTPTFIDDDTLLLAVKVSRTFFEASTANATFQQQVQTSKNSVTASVLAKFDQTVVISGLNERELIHNGSGAPLLRDVPVAQYLFQQESSRSFNRNVMILLTPRRPVIRDASVAGPAREAAQGAAEALKRRIDGLRITPNLTISLMEIEDNRLFRAAFRGSDLISQDWTKMGGLQRAIREILDFLYY